MQYISKIVLTGMGRRKVETKALVGILILIYAFSTLFVVFQESFLKGKAEQRFEQYGEWQGVVCNAGAGIKELLVEKSDVLQTGTLLTVGDVLSAGKSVGKVGIMDKTLTSLGHVSMLEGRFPSAPREVAVEEHVLSLLPKGVKIGSEVPLIIAEDGKSSHEQQQYILTGIIKEWGDEWNIGGDVLPQILIVDAGQQERSVPTSYFFKMLNEEGELIEELKEVLKNGENGTYVYNDKAYPQSTNAMERFFSDGAYVAILLLISVILILCTLNIFMKKRKYRVQILRGMGATIGKMVYMSMWESIASFVPALVIGCILGVLGSWGIISVGKYFLKWNIKLSINSFNLFQILLLLTVFYVFSLLLLTLYLSGLPLSSSFRSDSGTLQRGKVPVLKEVKRLSTITITIRNRMFHRKQTYLRIGFSICAVTIMTVSLLLFRENGENYQFWKDQMSNNYLFQTGTLTDGIDLQTVKELEEIPGVVSVEKSKYLNVTDLAPKDIRVSWEGWKGNEYVTAHRRYSQVSDGMQPYDKEEDYFSVIELRGVSPTDVESFAYYEKVVSEGSFHRERFNEGKECILFLSPYQIRDTGSDVIDYNPVYVTEQDMDKSKRIYTYEQTGDIRSGDILEVSTPWGQSTITVGGIVYELMRPGENVIAVGEQFLDTFFVEDTSSLYNSVTIHSHAKANFAETDWNVEEVFRRKGIKRLPTNERIIYGEISGQFAAEMFQASVILLVVGLLYVLVMYQQNIAYIDIEKRRIGIFQSLGMSKHELKKMYLYNGVMDVGIISVISFFSCVVWFLVRLRLSTSFDSFSSLAKAIIDQQEKVQMLAIAWVGVIVFYILVYWATISNPAGKIMKLNIVDNIKDF